MLGARRWYQVCSNFGEIKSYYKRIVINISIQKVLESKFILKFTTICLMFLELTGKYFYI